MYLAVSASRTASAAELTPPQPSSIVAASKEHRSAYATVCVIAARSSRARMRSSPSQLPPSQPREKNDGCILGGRIRSFPGEEKNALWLTWPCRMRLYCWWQPWAHKSPAVPRFEPRSGMAPSRRRYLPNCLFVLTVAVKSQSHPTQCCLRWSVTAGRCSC